MTTLAPRLSHRITFQRQVEERADGVLSVSWESARLDDGVELVDVPAEVLTGAGREAVMSGQMQSSTVARITCRWFPGLDASWRILWDGKTFNISTFETDRTSRRELRITCTAGLNDGQ